jgi:HTH-type transcriptional regulator / antitoxin HipB
MTTKHTTSERTQERRAQPPANQAHRAPIGAVSQPAPNADAPAWVEVRNAKDLGRAIARQRKVLGYGLVDAAALCQVGTRFLFELEHGKATVEFDRALKVANRFGLHLKITGVE